MRKFQEFLASDGWVVIVVLAIVAAFVLSRCQPPQQLRRCYYDVYQGGKKVSTHNRYSRTYGDPCKEKEFSEGFEFRLRTFTLEDR